MSRDYSIEVDPLLCDGCAICIFFCRPGVFALSTELSGRGVFPVVTANVQQCNGCGLCELGCPQMAILLQGKHATTEGS